MTRFTLATASLVVSLPVLAQTAAPESALPVRPAPSIPTGADVVLPGSATAGSPLTDVQLAARLALFYERQSALFAAAASNDEAAYARILDELVADVHQLAYRPGILFEPRFRELYGAVLAEYERFYDRPALDRGDVYAVREAGIEAVERGYDLGAPLLEHVTLPDLGTYATTIPMDVNPHVDRYVQFLVGRRGHVQRLRERADTYFPMVERVLAEEGVPDELKYLAMVESALNPVAQSHAGAAGMWQFIRATGAAYGLQATSQVDDRLDPEQATRAAARHLRDLHDRFGDWQLALAGYNCNPAVIARAVRRFEERTGRRATFWDIMESIPRETRAYVPMFIATTLVVSNPAAYGMPDHTPGTAFTFDRLHVAGGTRLSEVARAIDVSESVLRALNPSLRAGVVPSGRTSHPLRIPVGHASEHAEALSRFSPRGGLLMAAETVQFGPRAVRPIALQERGAALVAMASRQAVRARHTSDAPVARATPVREYRAETPPEAVAFAARAEREAAARAAEVARAEAPVRADADLRVVAVAAPEAAPEPMRDEPIRVTVAVAAEPAETDDAPTTSVGLVSEDLLSLAQAATAPRAEPAAREVPRAAPAAEAPVRTVSARATTHRVARGETLTGIARQYGVSLADLRAWNGIDGDRLFVGRTLRLTGEAGAGRAARTRAAAPARPAAPTSHTVRSGENLSRIARQHGTTPAELRRLNNLSGDAIRAGQTLRLPARSGRSRG